MKINFSLKRIRDFPGITSQTGQKLFKLEVTQHRHIMRKIFFKIKIYACTSKYRNAKIIKI